MKRPKRIIEGIKKNQKALLAARANAIATKEAKPVSLPKLKFMGKRDDEANG